MPSADTPQPKQIPNDRRLRPRMDANARSLSPGNRLFLLWPLIAIVLLLLALAALSMEIMSGARAYVSGESLWSKGQKAAVMHLLDYVASGDQADYADYRRNIGITLGDRRAREALDRPDPDRAAAAQGFLDGGNDAGDVPSLIRLFVWFRWAPPMREAIDLWAEGDRLIGEIDAVARVAHGQISAGSLTADERAVLTLRVRQLNATLESVAVRFSWTLGDISRRIHRGLNLAMLVVSSLSLVVGVMLTRRMLRESQQVELDLRTSEASLREAQRLAEVGSWSHRVDRGQTEWSDQARRMLGGDDGGWMPAWGDYLDRIADADRGRIEAAWKAARSEGRPYEAEYRIQVPGRGQRWIHERGNPVSDASGEVVIIDGTVMDVSKRRDAEERVRQLAHYDELTGLPNRTLFQIELQRALVAAHALDTRLALMFIDLDRFKIINDTLGHDAGDLVLVEVAQRLRASLRDTDIVARLGGDEFVVLIEGIEANSEAAAVAQKVLEQIGRPIAIDERDYSVTASIGISQYPTDGQDVQALRKNADLAMYRAKEKGKNQYEFYSVYMSRRSSQQLALEADLRQALERGELVVHYQPRVRVAGGTARIVGCEALLRWQHPQRGLLSPGQFVGMAEETGLIVQIGLWVLETACRQNAAWRQAGLPPISVSVNVSARQLADRGFADQVGRVLEHSGMAADALELEITESLLMDHPERSVKLLHALNALGVRIAIDDFGTGHSSLAYLKRFPIDCIKIDRAFVADLPDEADACSIARAIVALAHSLQRSVVAEGVETTAQRDFLLQQGCDEFQGFLFSAAVDADTFAALHKAAAEPVNA